MFNQRTIAIHYMLENFEFKIRLKYFGRYLNGISRYPQIPVPFGKKVQSGNQNLRCDYMKYI